MLPPEGQYSSQDELRLAINNWAAPRGYAFVIKRSRTTHNGRREVMFNCDRGAGRAPSTEGVRVRQTKTRRTGCIFSVTAKESLDKTTWSLRHRPGAGFNQHNHEPSISQMEHPALRKLSSIEISTIQQLANTGITPKNIRSYMNSKFNILATQQDIYNCIAQGKRNLVVCTRPRAKVTCPFLRRGRCR